LQQPWRGRPGSSIDISPIGGYAIVSYTVEYPTVLKENHMKQVEIERLELEKEISQFLAQSFLELDEGERQLMRRFGLTLTQYWALVHLKDEEGRSLSELAALLICDKSNMTSLVDKLEASGLAERRHGKNGDRRYIRVVLTPQGHQLRNTLITAQEHLLHMRLRTFNVENLLKLHEPLQELARALQAQFKNNEVAPIIDSTIASLGIS
jgi:DNA-binding MarR family transcriptional regulator